MDMDRERLVHYLDQPRQCEAALRALRIRDAQRARANLIAIARAGVPLDLLDAIADS